MKCSGPLPQRYSSLQRCKRQAYSTVKFQMSAKEGYSKVLTGAGTDGISDAANFASDEAKLVEEGLSGLKSFSEAGLDTDFINGDDYGIIEYFADYDLLQLREDIDNTPSRVSEYFNALLKGLDTISDEIVVRFLLFVLSNLVEAISSSTSKRESVDCAKRESRKIDGAFRW